MKNSLYEGRKCEYKCVVSSWNHRKTETSKATRFLKLKAVILVCDGDVNPSSSECGASV